MQLLAVVLSGLAILRRRDALSVISAAACLVGFGCFMWTASTAAFRSLEYCVQHQQRLWTVQQVDRWYNPITDEITCALVSQDGRRAAVSVKASQLLQSW